MGKIHFFAIQKDLEHNSGLNYEMTPHNTAMPFTERKTT